MNAGDNMKKIILICTLLLALVCLCACGKATTNNSSTTAEPSTEAVSLKYESSQFLGKWYNAYAVADVADFELKADGTALYKGNTKGTWVDNGDDITINITIDGEQRAMTGYFVISGDGFVARATPTNQHYLTEGKGELQLEIMLTESTCIDCVKK